MHVSIAVTAGPYQGREFHFSGHEFFLVGRAKNSHFRLPHDDKYFSRLHFLVEINPPHCRLIDLRSTNGTFVNGQRVVWADLRDGDRIEGGQTVMRVTIAEDQPIPVDLEPRPATHHWASPLPPVVIPASPAATPGAPLTAVCVGCGSVAAPSAPGDDLEQTYVPPWPLCPGCQGQSQQLPQPFPAYRLIRELGRGGMGVVYLALHLQQGQVVALKTVTPQGECNAAQVERFLREARILEQLSHPNIVSFREMGECCGQFYFAMDFVLGIDAARLLQSHGPLPIDRAVGIVCQVLDALHHAHQCGFVHRDIKPANLLITQASGDCVKVLDFGLARAYQMSRLSGLSFLGQVGGTVPFMAPEQITDFRGSKPAVDQYAAAATLYNLLTGTYIHDFPTDFQRRLLLVLQDDPVPLRLRRPEVPEDLAGVIHRALSREPENRFLDAAMFRTALQPFAG